MTAFHYMWFYASVFVSLFASCAATYKDKPQQPRTVVDLGYAKYQGNALAAGVTQWRGMRFAAPPLGDLRWRAPRDPHHEKGIQKADQWKPACIGLFGLPLGPGASEDCLFLDVFAPSGATPKSKLPVWFFIQGGGYAGNTDDNFNGTEIIRQSGNNIVFVQINYRVGALGFLASEAVRRDGDLNVGLLDQRKALEWTRKYIHLFGGDPDHVVIHGDSAGAGSVAYHLTAYGGKGRNLFVGAIAESPFFPTHRTVAVSELQFEKYVSDLNCSDARHALRCLRKLDSTTLQTANILTTYPGAPKDFLPQWSWLPVVDGDLSPDLLYNLLEQGRMKRVPLMVGSDTDEGTSFVPSQVNSSETFSKYIKANYPRLTTDDIKRIKRAYPSPGKQFLFQNSWFGPAEAAYGESTLICPGIQMTKSLAHYFSSKRTWNYRYNVADDAVAYAGVYHVSEKPAIFGTNYVADGCGAGCTYETYNKNIVPVVMHYWISFIRSLNPNTHKYAAAPVWEPWGHSEGSQRLRFETNKTQMEMVPSDQLARCSMWKSMSQHTEQ